jgi:hypothetical protein
MDCGLWTVDYGLWIMDCGLWTVDQRFLSHIDLAAILLILNRVGRGVEALSANSVFNQIHNSISTVLSGILYLL